MEAPRITAPWNVPAGAIIRAPHNLPAKNGLPSVAKGAPLTVVSSFENGRDVLSSTATTFRVDAGNGRLRLVKVAHIDDQGVEVIA